MDGTRFVTMYYKGWGVDKNEEFGCYVIIKWPLVAKGCDWGEKIFQELFDINFRQYYYSPKSYDSSVIAISLNLQSVSGSFQVINRVNKIIF